MQFVLRFQVGRVQFHRALARTKRGLPKAQMMGRNRLKRVVRALLAMAGEASSADFLGFGRMQKLLWACVTATRRLVLTAIVA